jgi:hypothetical protein
MAAPKVKRRIFGRFGKCLAFFAKDFLKAETLWAPVRTKQRRAVPKGAACFSLAVPERTCRTYRGSIAILQACNQRSEIDADWSTSSKPLCSNAFPQLAKDAATECLTGCL